MNGRMHATRRQFLRSTAGASFLLPYLPSLSKSAEAQAVAPKKRLIVVYASQQEADGYLPKQDASGALSVDSTNYVQPLAPFLNKALWVFGTVGGYNHMSSTEILTGQYHLENAQGHAPHYGPSIDQIVAKRLGTVTRLPSLELAAGEDNDGMSRTDTHLLVPGILSPRRAFERVFGSAAGSTPTAGADPARLRLLRRSMLDTLKLDYKRVSDRLAAPDRLLLDQHVTLLRDLEKRLQVQESIPPVACDKGTAPATTEKNFMNELPARTRDHMDVILRAIACDATRVVTLVLDRFSGNFPPYPFIPGSVSMFHDVAHGDGPNPQGQFFAVRKWQMEQFAYLLKGLDSMREGDRTVLDNSLVLWVNELGYAKWGITNSHDRGICSSIIVGSCGGYFKTGRLVDVRKSSYHNLLLTVGRAMGLQDLTTFGQKGNRVLTELTG